MNIIHINNYEDCVKYLQTLVFNNEICILDYYFIHNVGIKLLKNTIDTLNINTKTSFIFNCKDSLSYVLYCIESKIPYIIYQQNNNNLDNLYNLALKNNSLIFQNIEKSIEYFKNIYYTN